MFLWVLCIYEYLEFNFRKNSGCWKFLNYQLKFLCYRLVLKYIFFVQFLIRFRFYFKISFLNKKLHYCLLKWIVLLKNLNHLYKVTNILCFYLVGIYLIFNGTTYINCILNFYEVNIVNGCTNLKVIILSLFCKNNLNLIFFLAS
jgi:hypothetical protein